MLKLGLEISWSHGWENPERTQNKLFLIVLGVLGLFLLLCCGGAFFFGMTKLDEIEKIYHSDCENLVDGVQCEDCCRTHGHTGSVFGDFINDEGKTCGCI